VQVDGKFADAALGRFTVADAQADFVVVIEGKGPRDPLDRPFGSRKRSAVEQALQYAVNLQIDWFLVTNMPEIRLFHKGHDLFTYERFETATLANDDAALKRFAFLLGAERVVPAAGGTHLDALLADSRRIGRELTVDYYHEYATCAGRRSTSCAEPTPTSRRRNCSSLRKNPRPRAVHRLQRGSPLLPERQGRCEKKFAFYPGWNASARIGSWVEPNKTRWPTRREHPLTCRMGKFWRLYRRIVRHSMTTGRRWTTTRYFCAETRWPCWTNLPRVHRLRND